MGKILVVDDELEVCDMLKEFLSTRGYEVHIATDGLDALEKFKAVRPHLVLLDMRMPGMDGIEVLKEMKKLDPAVAVIMVTAVTEKDEAKSTFQFGAFDYITKPVNLDYLENVVTVKLLDALS
jgi:two-component system response regulator (stage 0 sporulation protein F)